MADQATIRELIEYYANLLIVQYHNKPKAQATIGATVDEIIADGIMFDIRDGYSVDTAVGKQLDIIGKYVGINRFYKGQVFDGFFSFISYDETSSPPGDRIGYSDYTDYEIKLGQWINYSQIISTDLILNDDDYRVIIKLKIIQNTSNHSHKSIDDSIYDFFGDSIYADSVGNMEMWYFIPVDLNAVMQVALQKDVLPRPMGVRINYFIPHEDSLFGFSSYDGYSPLIVGFSDYTDYDTKEGETLTYNKLIG